MTVRSIAIMQPYAFPSISYFQLAQSVDRFIFYDDVHFRKKSWINRNRINSSVGEILFTIPLSGASQNRLIKDIMMHDVEIFRERFLKTIKLSYHSAHFYKQGLEYMESCFGSHEMSIAKFSASTVENMFNLLGLEKQFLYSSEKFPDTIGMGRTERLIKIARENNAEFYHNSVGGMSLYSYEDFSHAGVELRFIRSNEIKYQQTNGHQFLPNLSIVDLVMNIGLHNICDYMNDYKVIKNV